MTDQQLVSAVEEIEKGLLEADLGGGVMKKRVGLGGRGKRVSHRTLLALRHQDKAFFVFGFARTRKAMLRPVN